MVDQEDKIQTSEEQQKFTSLWGCATFTSTTAENQQTPKEVDIQLNEAYGPLWIINNYLTLLSLFLTTGYLINCQYVTATKLNYFANN